MRTIAEIKHPADQQGGSVYYHGPRGGRYLLYSERTTDWKEMRDHEKVFHPARAENKGLRGGGKSDLGEGHHSVTNETAK